MHITHQAHPADAHGGAHFQIQQHQLHTGNASHLPDDDTANPDIREENAHMLTEHAPHGSLRTSDHVHHLTEELTEQHRVTGDEYGASSPHLSESAGAHILQAEAHVLRHNTNSSVNVDSGQLPENHHPSVTTADVHILSQPHSMAPQHSMPQQQMTPQHSISPSLPPQQPVGDHHPLAHENELTAEHAEAENAAAMQAPADGRVGKRARTGPKSAAILGRGASISLARRAAADAKKKRDLARAELERTGVKTGELSDLMEKNPAMRANVSQNRNKRVRRVKWRPKEVEALRKGVDKHGIGRWAVILREYAKDFDPVRISVDLKDKWRNIFKVPKTPRHPRDSQVETQSHTQIHNRSLVKPVANVTSAGLSCANAETSAANLSTPDGAEPIVASEGSEGKACILQSHNAEQSQFQDYHAQEGMQLDHVENDLEKQIHGQVLSSSGRSRSSAHVEAHEEAAVECVDKRSMTAHNQDSPNSYVRNDLKNEARCSTMEANTEQLEQPFNGDDNGTAAHSGFEDHASQSNEHLVSMQEDGIEQDMESSGHRMHGNVRNEQIEMHSHNSALVQPLVQHRIEESNDATRLDDEKEKNDNRMVKSEHILARHQGHHERVEQHHSNDQLITHNGQRRNQVIGQQNDGRDSEDCVVQSELGHQANEQDMSTHMREEGGRQSLNEDGGRVLEEQDMGREDLSRTEIDEHGMAQGEMEQSSMVRDDIVQGPLMSGGMMADEVVQDEATGGEAVQDAAIHDMLRQVEQRVDGESRHGSHQDGSQYDEQHGSMVSLVETDFQDMKSAPVMELGDGGDDLEINVESKVIGAANENQILVQSRAVRVGEDALGFTGL